MTYGPDAVHELIVESGWSYPVSAGRLERNMPMENVVIDAAGNSMMLSELLHAAEADRFESREDLERKLGPVCESESRARQSGIVDRLKRTFLG
ncbi:hypothetical protein [Halomicrobium salinisoli]|uniref:hypothetical protein n=1 Tax=Halomicrobium salinisoli TaxID=2878391 RepID=UPI001CF038A4|nr:hypothetical protein [Halomicrobium salinisoli]